MASAPPADPDSNSATPESDRDSGETQITPAGDNQIQELNEQADTAPPSRDDSPSPQELQPRSSTDSRPVPTPNYFLPTSLTAPILCSFIALYVIFIISLVVMFCVSQRNQGLAYASNENHILGKYGPTAGMVAEARP
jgi:hypothetical protein